MIIGIPKEVKIQEFRVGLLPVHVEELIRAGHAVVVEKNAGVGSGALDSDYRDAGAQVLNTARDVWKRADMIVKVKEPQPEEIPLMQAGQIVFTYFHFAASRKLTESVIKSKIVAIAYETVQSPDGTLPLLTPMSEIAGRMSVHEGAKCLEKPMKGRGLLLAGVPGVSPAKVAVIGGGVVGTNAAKMAAGLGADVTILDISLPRLRYLDDVMPKNVRTLMSNIQNVREQVQAADLVIGAVLVPGAKAPQLVTRDMVSKMKRGAVIVDVAIDQGGCIETSRPTTHDEPTYAVHEVVHYAVTNMPSAVAGTSTPALTNATFPYVLQLANKGWQQATKDNKSLASGVSIVEGKVHDRRLAELFRLSLAN